MSKLHDKLDAKQNRFIPDSVLVSLQGKMERQTYQQQANFMVTFTSDYSSRNYQW